VVGDYMQIYLCRSLTLFDKSKKVSMMDKLLLEFVIICYFPSFFKKKIFSPLFFNL